jgi:hypothetical protein
METYSALHEDTFFKIPVVFHNQRDFASEPAANYLYQGSGNPFVGTLSDDCLNPFPNNQPEYDQRAHGKHFEIATRRYGHIGQQVKVGVSVKPSGARRPGKCHDKNLSQRLHGMEFLFIGSIERPAITRTANKTDPVSHSHPLRILL